jgi:hypothetical protein
MKAWLLRRLALLKLIYVIVIALVLLLAAEMGVTLFAEHGAERVLQSQYGMPPNLKVSINSFPLLVSLMRNHLGEIRITWNDDLYMFSSLGGETALPYLGQAVVDDVELDMPSLLRGRLDIKKISRIKAVISVEEASINQVFGNQNMIIDIQDGSLFVTYKGLKIQYEVKVADDNSLAVTPFPASTNGGDSAINPQSEVQPPSLVIKAYALPLDSKVESVRLEGDKFIMGISIPMWEGYL